MKRDQVARKERRQSNEKVDIERRASDRDRRKDRSPAAKSDVDIINDVCNAVVDGMSRKSVRGI